MHDLAAGLIGLLLACALPIGILLGFGIPYLINRPRMKREQEAHEAYMRRPY